MNQFGESPWTDERVTLLRQHWAEGLSASQVAKKLGGFAHCRDGGRSAVIGKINRIGLSGRTRVTATDVLVTHRIKKRRRKAINFIPNSVLKPVKLAPPSEAIEPALFDGVARTVSTIEPNECRFIASEGMDAPMCGRRTIHGPWCSLHVHVVYQPSRRRKTEDASIKRVTEWLDRKSRRVAAEARI